MKNLTALKNFMVLSLTWRDFRPFMYSAHDSRLSNDGKYNVPI